jgi:thiol-disulfide isomerase/thioredoxin
MPRLSRSKYTLLVAAGAGLGGLIGASVGLGCGETVTSSTTRVVATSEDVLTPKAPDHPVATAESPKNAPAPEPEKTVTLRHLRFDEFRSKVATNPKAKYTLVDVWDTTCGPCKKNFPHLVDMHRRFAAEGLAVVSLSLDDPTNAKQVKDAEQFLKEQKAYFTNVLLDEEHGVGYERLDINTIPAVFLFGPDGKEVKRFTMDDPDNQFTYDEVEKTVATLLKGK